MGRLDPGMTGLPSHRYSINSNAALIAHSMLVSLALPLPPILMETLEGFPNLPALWLRQAKPASANATIAFPSAPAPP
jgi:hypothetical protein